MGITASSSKFVLPFSSKSATFTYYTHKDREHIEYVRFASKHISQTRLQVIVHWQMNMVCRVRTATGRMTIFCVNIVTRPCIRVEAGSAACCWRSATIAWAVGPAQLKLAMTSMSAITLPTDNFFTANLSGGTSVALLMSCTRSYKNAPRSSDPSSPAFSKSSCHG